MADKHGFGHYGTYGFEPFRSKSTAQISRDGPYRRAKETVEGRVTTVAFIPDRPSKNYDEKVPDNRFVVFGDNRDNARDSRYIGMVDRDAVIGRVVKVFGSRSPTSD